MANFPVRLSTSPRALPSSLPISSTFFPALISASIVRAFCVSSAWLSLAEDDSSSAIWDSSRVRWAVDEDRSEEEPVRMDSISARSSSWFRWISLERAKKKERDEHFCVRLLRFDCLRVRGLLQSYPPLLIFPRLPDLHSDHYSRNGRQIGRQLTLSLTMIQKFSLIRFIRST